MSQTRQLAAIMFTDIVGYTALMGKDEQKAFDLLNKNRQIQKPIIEGHNGIWIKELGDGVMASFKTVSDAVNAAIRIQQTCNANKEFQLRIGIHQGEVVIEENDMFGDAVNIASRIQGIAVPGSIFISEVVHHNVSNKNDIHTEFVKTENLKNVREPVRIYQIKFDGAPPAPQRPLKSIERKNFVFILLGIAVMTLLGYFVFQSSKKTNVTATNNEIADRSIAVLPFVNMSNDKEQEYFSDGLSEELLNLLAKTPELKVIGRTSSFSFKGKNEDLRSIAQKLGVAHILEGSVRKDGNKIRVTAQLIKASDGSHSWSETYEENMKGLFKLQDKIAGAVVKQLKVKLLSSSSGGSISSNIEVHNLILQGNYFFDKLDKDNVAKAVELYHRALAIDSNDARAWGKLANAVSRQSWQNYIDQNTGYEKARQAALKAVSLDNNYATGYLELGDIKLYHDFDWKGAMDAHQMAFSLEPGNAEVINGLGDVHLPVGLLKEAEQFYKKSILLDPLKPIVHMNLGNTLTSMGRYQEAIASFKKALDVNPQFQRAHMYIGRNYLLIGKPDSALKEMEKENVEVFKAFGLALVYHALGRKPEGDETLKEFTEKYQNNWSYLLAQLHAFRGEKDEAFGWLETAYNKKDSWLFWVKGDPLLKNLKTDPRYNAFLKKMNLKPD
jgi:TolB-like protein/class 3 adenylate cyclase/Flp pilus assembly protein TadD